MLLLISVISPLVRYRRALSQVVDTLEIWAKKQSQGTTKTLVSRPSNDAIANRTTELVKQIVEDRAKLEQSLAELRKREEVSELANQVAHDIRSPLAALQALTEQLKGLSEAERRLFGQITSRIHQIAEELLDHKRKKANEECQLLNMVTLVKEVLEEKRLERPKIGNVIELAVDSSINSDVFANRQGLQRAVSNLVNNAIEAIDTTRCREKSVVVQLVNAGEKSLQLSVIDTGPGITPAHLKRLGKKGASFGKTEGSGLGLYQATQTVRKSGGSLEIESVVGKGTTVKITLPVGYRLKEPTKEVDEERLMKRDLS